MDLTSALSIQQPPKAPNRMDLSKKPPLMPDSSSRFPPSLASPASMSRLYTYPEPAETVPSDAKSIASSSSHISTADMIKNAVKRATFNVLERKKSLPSFQDLFHFGSSASVPKVSAESSKSAKTASWSIFDYVSPSKLKQESLAVASSRLSHELARSANPLHSESDVKHFQDLMDEPLSSSFHRIRRISDSKPQESHPSSRCTSLQASTDSSFTLNIDAYGRDRASWDELMSSPFDYYVKNEDYKEFDTRMLQKSQGKKRNIRFISSAVEGDASVYSCQPSSQCSSVEQALNAAISAADQDPRRKSHDSDRTLTVDVCDILEDYCQLDDMDVIEEAVQVPLVEETKSKKRQGMILEDEQSLTVAQVTPLISTIVPPPAQTPSKWYPRASYGALSPAEIAFMDEIKTREPITVAPVAPMEKPKKLSKKRSLANMFKKWLTPTPIVSHEETVVLQPPPVSNNVIDANSPQSNNIFKQGYKDDEESESNFNYESRQSSIKKMSMKLQHKSKNLVSKLSISNLRGSVMGSTAPPSSEKESMKKQETVPLETTVPVMSAAEKRNTLRRHSLPETSSFFNSWLNKYGEGSETSSQCPPAEEARPVSRRYSLNAPALAASNEEQAQDMKQVMEQVLFQFFQSAVIPPPAEPIMDRVSLGEITESVSQEDILTRPTSVVQVSDDEHSEVHEGIDEAVLSSDVMSVDIQF